MGHVIGSVMAGYDGHRAWINRIAVQTTVVLHQDKSSSPHFQCGGSRI
jgi:hypothetical protein